MRRGRWGRTRGRGRCGERRREGGPPRRRRRLRGRGGGRPGRGRCRDHRWDGRGSRWGRRGRRRRLGCGRLGGRRLGGRLLRGGRGRIRRWGRRRRKLRRRLGGRLLRRRRSRPGSDGHPQQEGRPARRDGDVEQPPVVRLLTPGRGIVSVMGERRAIGESGQQGRGRTGRQDRCAQQCPPSSHRHPKVLTSYAKSWRDKWAHGKDRSFWTYRPVGMVVLLTDSHGGRASYIRISFWRCSRSRRRHDGYRSTLGNDGPLP